MKRQNVQEVASAYHRIFSGDSGRLVLEHLRVSLGVDAASYVPGVGLDVVAYREGMKAAFAHIERWIEKGKA